MPGIEVFEPSFPELAVQPWYDWTVLPSAQSENSPIPPMELFFDSECSSPMLSSSQGSRQSSADPSLSIHRNRFSYPANNDPAVSHQALNHAHSEQSESFWNADDFQSGLTELSADANLNVDEATKLDRSHRRREQNRKAQSNFRHKRKEEVRRLEREVQDLRAQVANFHKRGPTANLTICTTCRNFFPITAAGGV